MFERVGRGRGAQGMGSDLDAKRGGIVLHQSVHTVGSNRLFHSAALSAVSQRAEQRAGRIAAVCRGVEIVVNELGRKLMKRHVSLLIALALHEQMRDALNLKPVILNPEPAEFGAAEAVIEKGGQNGAIRLALSVSSTGALRSPRACRSAMAGVLPVLRMTVGRFTPLRGLWSAVVPVVRTVFCDS
jgi:hypothetical protein